MFDLEGVTQGPHLLEELLRGVHSAVRDLLLQLRGWEYV
jgi:hypothetical protein